MKRLNDPDALPSSFFVIGTDTGVGKTHVCAALLRALRTDGLRVVGMKPVAAGAQFKESTGTWENEDAERLRAASSVKVPSHLDNPVLLREPLSPHLAAQHEGVRISLNTIVEAHAELTRLADIVVVEGAGGFLVPLGESDEGNGRDGMNGGTGGNGGNKDDDGEHSALVTGADLAVALRVPVLLVVGMRLGCLNHALLTTEAVRARGLKLMGWIANRIDPDMACADENVEFLRRQLHAPLLADIPHGQDTEWMLPWSHFRTDP